MKNEILIKVALLLGKISLTL